MPILEKPELGPCRVDLYPYQWEAIDAARTEFAKGIKRTMFVLFTGAGKTIIAGMIARRAVEKGKRVLFLAHTDELVKQAANKMDKLGVEVGIEKADKYARSIFEPDVVVASIQTFWRPKRLGQWDPEYFDLIIYDECHHILGGCNRKVVNYFSKARLLGLTATHDRGDGEDLGQVFESIAFKRDLAFAWDPTPPGPYATDVIPVQRDMGINLKDLRVKKGEDLNDAMLEARITPHIEALANLTKVEAGDRSTLIFTPQVKSAQGMATALQHLGVKAEWTAGDDPHCAEKIKRYEMGELQALASCAKLTEGFDAPRTSAIVMLRPTKSRVLYAQIVGRGIRRFPGKENCFFIDPGFLAEEHELVTLAELLDHPGQDAEVTDIANDILKKDPELGLNKAVERAKEVHREQSVLRIKAKEKAIRARRVSYSMRDVYATVGLGWRGPQPKDSPVNPATQKQVDWLNKLGVDDAASMSKTRATTLLDFLKDRMNKGLATHKQVAHLIANDVDPKEARAMTKQEASERLDKIFTKRRTG